MSETPIPPAPTLVALPGRGVLALSGPERVAFLQGLVSNDVSKPTTAVWSALLTPQGKYLHDFFVVPDGERLLLECEAGRREDLFRRLRMYKLRSKVELADVTDDFAAFAVIGQGAGAAVGLGGEPGAVVAYAGGIAYADPRVVELGARLLLPAGTTPDLAAGDFATWDGLRLSLGVPDGSRDLVVDKSILLENGFDELRGVAWDKGCYVGQELTARTKYRGLVKKRLLPVAVDGPLPGPGTMVMAGEREAGEVRSGVDGLALAVLRLDALDAELTAGEARLVPHVPGWVKLPEKA